MLRMSLCLIEHKAIGAGDKGCVSVTIVSRAHRRKTIDKEQEKRSRLKGIVVRRQHKYTNKAVRR